MTLLSFLIAITVSPADSARALIQLRSIPEAAVLYAQMAAVEDGSWLLEYGRLLEASGLWSRAASAYRLALAGAGGQESARWIMNRLQGCSNLDTTLVITVEIENLGSMSARNLQVIIPMPRVHEPYQEMRLLQTDFSISSGVLYANIGCLEAGMKKELVISLIIHQEPWTSRPVSHEAISEGDLSWLSRVLRSMDAPDVLPGPCLPMSMDLAVLGEERGMPLEVTGGIILDGDSCLFHAWNTYGEWGIRIDPVLFASDSLLGFAHAPTDVIPLWDMAPTDGCEVTVLYDNPDYSIGANMTAELR